MEGMEEAFLEEFEILNNNVPVSHYNLHMILLFCLKGLEAHFHTLAGIFNIFMFVSSKTMEKGINVG